MFAEIFIRRPRLAMVIAVLITLAGSIALLNIPVAQYPDITPPTIQVTASYPGADAVTVAETVAGPIEQQVNGVEGMIYMSSTSSSSGIYSLTVTFAIGTDPDIAQVNVQNRVALATPLLPDAVTRLGVNVRAQQPNFLVIANVYSPNGSRDGLFLSNYAQINVVNPVSRVAGVGSANLMGGLSYSMRIWLDPQRMAALGITSDDVTNAVSQQNVQAGAGLIGAPPIPDDQVLQYSIRAGTSKIRSSVVAAWTTAPFRRVVSESFDGSPTSSAVTSQGPKPPVEGKFFPATNWLVCFCQSRTLPSL